MTGEQILRQLTTVFQDVFDNENLTISEHTSADDIADWDSLMHITLISAVEDEFQVKFDMQEIIKMQNVGQMAELIGQKLENR